MTSGINNSNGHLFTKATIQNLDDIKKLADQHKHELGFIIRSALERSINAFEVIVAIDKKDGNSLLGFLHYHHRKDGQTTVYNIAVNPSNQNQGIGARLIDTLRDESQKTGQKFILLKCPEQLPANEFYRKYGFDLDATEEGKKRPLAIWKLEM